MESAYVFQRAAHAILVLFINAVELPTNVLILGRFSPNALVLGGFANSSLLGV